MVLPQPTVPAVFRADAPARVLVTGGAGFLGRALVAQLLAQTQARIVVLALPGEPVPADWAAAGERLQLVRGDITVAADVETAMRDCGWVFHLAALVGDHGLDADHQRVTVGGTEHVFAAAQRVRAAVVLVTSICVYGDAIRRGVCTEHMPWGLAQGPYGRAKQGQERLARRFHADGGQVCVVRPANIIGPGSGPWVRDVAQALRQGLPALVDGGLGNAALAGVDNVADFLLHVAAHPQTWGRVYQVHDGLPQRWCDYFGDLARLLGTHPPRSIPRSLAAAGAWLAEPLFKRLMPGRRPPITREALNLIGSDNRFPLDRAYALSWQPKIDYATQLARIAEALRAH